MALSPSLLPIFFLFHLSFSRLNPFITSTTNPNEEFDNPNLAQAYTALQTWKSSMLSDPTNFTSNWFGPDICSYNGIFCAVPPGSVDFHDRVVASIDLNQADIGGSLPDQLGLLSHLAVFHVNSNRFCGTIPKTFYSMRLLYELDLSNNRFAGEFPPVLLSLPSLKYLDIRFNDFEGPIPPEVFDKPLDALFLNNNRFTGGVPSNIGNIQVSVLVVANNDLGGCIPPSIGHMANTLDEIILLNDDLAGCLPCEIGLLNNVSVFDVGFNNLVGSLPASIGNMKGIEQLNVAHNKFTGKVSASICALPNLKNFTYSFNFFSNEASVCAALSGGGKVVVDGSENCILGKKKQKLVDVCSIVDTFDCYLHGCLTKLMHGYFDQSLPPLPESSLIGKHFKMSPPCGTTTPPPPTPSLMKPPLEEVYDETILPPVEGILYDSLSPP